MLQFFWPMTINLEFFDWRTRQVRSPRFAFLAYVGLLSLFKILRRRFFVRKETFEFAVGVGTF